MVIGTPRKYDFDTDVPLHYTVEQFLATLRKMIEKAEPYCKELVWLNPKTAQRMEEKNILANIIIK